MSRREVTAGRNSWRWSIWSTIRWVQMVFGTSVLTRVFFVALSFLGVFGRVGPLAAVPLVEVPRRRLYSIIKGKGNGGKDRDTKA
jgi:hypothetical protein